MEYFKRLILDSLFPPCCIGCGKGGAVLCPACETSLPNYLPPFCAICAKPLQQGEMGKRRKGETRLHGSSHLCAYCAGSPLAIDGIRSVFRYEGVVREGILRLKYHGLRSLAAPLGALMGRYLLAQPMAVEAIVPVPLFSRRLRERGYNQSVLLAREAAGIAGLRLVEDALVRIKDTPSQVRSGGAEERRRNVQGAFRANEADLQGLRVLVLDDVCTTGSTLEACSLALREAGATAVWGLTLARET